MKPTQKDKAQALETLAHSFPKGSTVYTILDSVSRSGMQARVRVLAHHPAPVKDGFAYFTHPNWACAVACGFSLNRDYRDAVKVNGCGFDRQEAVKEAIERALGYAHGDLRHESI